MNVIEFPGLWGLKFYVNRSFPVFGIDIYWYGVIIAAGFLLAVLLGLKDSRKFGFESENIIDLVLFAAPVAIICARLYYVVFNFDLYRDNLLNILNTREGGLAILGGLIGALGTACIYARVKKIPLMKLFDFAMPYFALAQAIGRWGNFVNQEAFGTNTTLPWGMTGNEIRDYLSREQFNLTEHNIFVNPNIPVHPTFLYESLWDLGVFLILIWYRKRKKSDGEVFFLYMVLYGLGRSWIEGLRTDSLWLGNLRVSQVLSVVFVIFFGTIFVLRRRKIALSLSENVAVGTSEYGSVLEKLKEEDRAHDTDSDGAAVEIENPGDARAENKGTAEDGRDESPTDFTGNEGEHGPDEDNKYSS
ncbi:MAG: prolipoprotein diacylglyceryl transferase [Clostridiales bacterium]|jgi:phosphatidylglycerol:prolipoprotein diacylglycerol transferase|nr:prolipoprotein diacylglyceryl transferase [Eubacteriales bacterium]MDH7564926.1 prolipoprotein diacylglyceryl transferase [Clostridiales bacterium]